MTSPNASRRLYLDHAATSWPKSPDVLAAMHDYAVDFGATAGRGGYRSAQSAGQIIAQTRRDVARLVGAGAATEISFHASGTAALNAALFGFLKPGDHVVTTACEHNSVLRPLEALRVRDAVDLSIVPCDRNGSVATPEVVAALRSDTRLVAVTHVSNVTGAVQPIEDIAKALTDHPAALLVDAAQSLGWIPIDVSIGIDFLAAPTHKAIGGPFGTAILFARTARHEQISPTLFGGTGSSTPSLAMPEMMPGKLEAGNLNVPAIAALRVAVSIHRAKTLREGASLAEAATSLGRQLHHGLRDIDGVTIFGKPSAVPVVSFRVAGYTPAEVASILDAEFSIEVRSGLHCAALIHRHLDPDDIPSGVDEDLPGTVRVSAGHDTSADDIGRFLDAIRAIAKAV